MKEAGKMITATELYLRQRVKELEEQLLYYKTEKETRLTCYTEDPTLINHNNDTFPPVTVNLHSYLDIKKNPFNLAILYKYATGVGYYSTAKSSSTTDDLIIYDLLVKKLTNIIVTEKLKNLKIEKELL